MPDSARGIRARIIQLFRRLLEHDSRFIFIRAHDGHGESVEIVSPPKHQRIVESVRELPEVASRLLAAATSTPQTAKALARKAGYAWGSYVRAALAELVRRGLLAHTPDGYRRP